MGAARALGIATATLRSWDRRYGMTPSLHTKGGHRRYSPADMARLQAMGRMVREGVPPAEAARACLAMADTDRAPGVQVPDLPDDAGSVHGGAEQGTAQVVALPTSPVRGLARAAQALDSRSCADILHRYMQERGAAAAWEDLARPVLAGIGSRWAATGAGVETEHAFSHAVTLAFGAHANQALRAPVTGQTVLLASTPDELHDIPLVVLAAVLAERGIPTVQLGARTPPRALGDAISRLRPSVLVLWALDPRSAVVPELPALRPAPTLLLSGPGWPGTEGRTSSARETPVTRDLEGTVNRITSLLGLSAGPGPVAARKSGSA